MKRLLSHDYFARDRIDPATNQPFFRQDAKKRFDLEMCYVRKNYVSDPPGVDLYRKLHQIKGVNGAPNFQLYYCLRSSSALEGYHLHLRLCRKACAMGAGPRWHDALSNEFDFRWVLRALKSVVDRGVLSCVLPLPKFQRSLAETD